MIKKKVQRKWKYAKPLKERTFEEYLNLPLDEEHAIVAKHWNFSEEVGESGTTIPVFRADVVMFDGAATHKNMVIKNYAAVQLIKKAVARKKSVKDTLSFSITRRYDQDTMEYVYDIEFG